MALLALLMLAAVPATAEAKNFKVDGRVSGVPTASGGAVSVPLTLTRPASRKLALGTRGVKVKIKRRARLRLSGSDAQGATRLRAAALRVGDRVKGVTSLTRKAKRRMRYTPRPTLKLKRVRVIRNKRRLAAPPGGGGAPPAAPRTLEQVLSELSGRVMGLNARVGEFGSLPQQIEAQKLQLETLGTGLEEVATAFEAVAQALDGRVGFEAAFARAELLVERVGGLETSSSAVEDLLGQFESGLGTISGVLEELTTLAPLLSSQAALIRQFPGAESQVLALDEALRRIEGRIGSAEAALGTIGSSVGGLSAAMSALTGQANGVASTAATDTLPAVEANLNALEGGVANLESSFGSLASLGGAAGDIAGLEADATAIEGMVEMLCTTMACP